MTILFVCTGNTCRSPMAAALMALELDKRGVQDIIIENAGLSAYGEPAAPNAISVIDELDQRSAETLGRHRSHNITEEQLINADIIAVMSDAHAGAAIRRGADPKKVHILSTKKESGITDPFGGDIDTYRETRDRLIEAVGALADDIL
ncbi:MAG: low molecular weight phosphatase family protein [Oscillospiraceae bacterium]|nr:low molecular weight phosphatase family protein [Oscillospiraceae bacterium]